jgi:glycosyltransferase involved in cell wall biosynthesis
MKHVLILGGSPNHLGGVEAFCQRSKEALECQNDSWRLSYLPTGTAYLTVGRIPSLIRGIGRLISYRREKPDCVWLQYVCLPDLTYLAVAKLLGLTVMVTPHLGSNWRSQLNPVLRSISGWLLSFADRLALISKTQELEVNLPPKVPRSYIRNFLPSTILSAFYSPSRIQDHCLQLVHSGRLSEGKGTFLFVDVCKRLFDANVDFEANITGGADEPTIARLAGMIATHGLTDRVHILGRVSDSQLIEILSKSDVLVHLSRIDSYPLIVLESMLCDTFPICMELAGARDMIETYDGHVVSDRTPVKETAEFLITMNIEEIRARSQVAANRVRTDYDWALCAKAVQDAIAATISGKE